MTLSSGLLLSLAYVLPLVMLALTVIGRPPSRLRLTVILALLPVFYIGHLLALDGLQGWPSDGPPPDEFRLLAQSVREPDPTKDDPGEILIWLRSSHDATPRVHRLAYSKALHEELAAAVRRQADDRPQRGRREAGGNGAEPREVHAEWRFEDEIRPALPAKAEQPRAPN